MKKIYGFTVETHYDPLANTLPWSAAVGSSRDKLNNISLWKYQKCGRTEKEAEEELMKFLEEVLWELCIL